MRHKIDQLSVAQKHNFVNCIGKLKATVFNVNIGFIVIDKLTI